MQARDYDFADHDKTHRLVQLAIEISLPPRTEFKIGDRVKSKSVNHLSGEIFDTDYRENPEWFYVVWDGQEEKLVVPFHVSDLELETPPSPLEQCPDISNISICSQELAVLPSQANELEASPPPNSLKSTKTRKPSSNLTGQISPSIQTSPTIHPDAASLTSSPLAFPAQEPAPQEAKQDSSTFTANYGLNPSERSQKADPDLSLLKILKDSSTEDFEQCLADSEYADIVGTIRSSYRQNGSTLHTDATDCLSLPTLTALAKGKSRAAGQSKCEMWFRAKGLLAASQCLSPQIMALLLGFPSDWTQCLWESIEVLEEELEADTCLVEQLSQLRQQSPWSESNISMLSSIELHDRLAELERERDLIRAIGPVALPKVWIEYGKVAKRKFRQAYYRSVSPIFPAKRQSSESGLVKRCYLGEENSKEVKAAGESIARRNRLDSIAREIKQIEKKLEEVDDCKRHPCN